MRQFSDFAKSPPRPQVGPATEYAKSMAYHANAPTQKRPLHPPYLGRHQPIHDGKSRAHQYENHEVDVKAHPHVYLPRGPHHPFMFIHGSLLNAQSVSMTPSECDRPRWRIPQPPCPSLQRTTTHERHFTGAMIEPGWSAETL